MRLAVLSPIPPAPTGIADYTAEVLALLAPSHEIHVFHSQGAVDSMALRQFAPCANTNRNPTAAEQEELDALDRHAAELEQQAQTLDDAPEWSPDEAGMIVLEEQDIAARRKAIHEALKTWTPEQTAHAGVIVTIGREGDVEVMRGLVRDEDRKAIAAAVRSKGAKAHRDPDDPRDDEGAPSMAVAPERRVPGCSDALTKRLAAHRTMALQAMLA